MYSIILKCLNQPLFTNAFAIVVVRGTTMATRLLVLFLIARHVEPKIFGVISLVLAIVEISKCLADFGADTIAVREFAVRSQVEQKDFARILSVTKFVTISIVSTLYLLLCVVLRQYDLVLCSILGILIATGLWGNIYFDYFQAQLKIKLVVLPTVFSNIITIILSFGLLYLNAPIVAILAILPIFDGINACFFARYFNRELGANRRHVSVAEVLKLLQKCLPVAGTLIISILYTRLDVLILSAFLTAEALGYYGVAFRITEPFMMIAGAFSASSYSYLSVAIANGRDDIPSLVKKYGTSVAAYGAVSCMLLALLAPVIIRWTLPSYVAATPILLVLAVALLFRVVNGYLTSVIHAYGRFFWITRAAVFNLVLIGGLLLIFVPTMGAVGAAVSLLVGEMINSAVQLVLVKKLMLNLPEAFQRTPKEIRVNG
jgi:O-antigen/teichoic acid export membrane protein